MQFFNKLFNFKSLVSNDDIVSVCDGEIISLDQIEDETFKKQEIGLTFAIEPCSGDICSPVNGTIDFVFPTKHAFGVTMKDGTKILVHIGLNTVELNGEYFVVYKKEGDEVYAGEKIVDVDLDSLIKASYKPTTMIIIVENPSCKKYRNFNKKDIQRLESILK